MSIVRLKAKIPTPLIIGFSIILMSIIFPWTHITINPLDDLPKAEFEEDYIPSFDLLKKDSRYGTLTKERKRKVLQRWTAESLASSPTKEAYRRTLKIAEEEVDLQDLWIHKKSFAFFPYFNSDSNADIKILIIIISLSLLVAFWKYFYFIFITLLRTWKQPEIGISISLIFSILTYNIISYDNYFIHRMQSKLEISIPLIILIVGSSSCIFLLRKSKTN